MRALVAAALGLSVASCAPVVNQASPAFIEVGASYVTPASELLTMAQAHCEKFGRNARQQAVREAFVSGGGGRWITYDCVP